MTREAFVFWLNLLRLKDIAGSDLEAASLLGVTKNTMVRLKKDGTDRRTALACQAILHRLPPFQKDLFSEQLHQAWNEKPGT